MLSQGDAAEPVPSRPVSIAERGVLGTWGPGLLSPVCPWAPGVLSCPVREAQCCDGVRFGGGCRAVVGIPVGELCHQKGSSLWPGRAAIVSARQETSRSSGPHSMPAARPSDSLDPPSSFLGAERGEPLSAGLAGLPAWLPTGRWALLCPLAARPVSTGWDDLRVSTAPRVLLPPMAQPSPSLAWQPRSRIAWLCGVGAQAPQEPACPAVPAPGPPPSGRAAQRSSDLEPPLQGHSRGLASRGAIRRGQSSLNVLEPLSPALTGTPSP